MTISKITIKKYNHFCLLQSTMQTHGDRKKIHKLFSNFPPQTAWLASPNYVFICIFKSTYEGPTRQKKLKGTNSHSLL